MSLINVWDGVRKWGTRVCVGSGLITFAVTAFGSSATLAAWVIFLIVSVGIGWFFDHVTDREKWNISREVNN